ncbi:hypothetical protein [Leptospira licerasiae]|uniref:Chemotaxis protein n=1 Tax=Leptospira licerasiae str. MMD4847 TaxID=1049971 RepID=A0ABN0H3Q6_9LEPT|nr:hypothetical protein [Leptospira licerasiae]EIE01914.1 hypothetical protein LEP1GSC185_1870 [Leptospira licerasiae serovar Varillal str. VAR 010]EJZ40289.1 hypothetical protein LEP1GSC178_1136 [Leptospira licerasiae str. MMD4847]TGM90052.1 hypothetical protein EHR05_04415 [Leptospira licerasiae]
MEIFVNEQKLESVIENEKNLGEVFDAVRRWVETNGKFLLSCVVDGEEFTQNTMRDSSISNVSKMEFFVGEELDILISSLHELDSYVDKVGTTLLGRDSLTEKESKELTDGIEWIRSLLESAGKLLKLKYDQIKPMGTGSTVSDILDALSRNSSKLDGTTAIEEFLEYLRDLKLFVMDLVARASVLDLELPTLREILDTFIKAVPALKESFVKVNESYQAGKDEVATHLLTQSVSQINVLLTSFITLRQKLPGMDFSKIQIAERTFEEKTNDLNDTLASVALALEEKDIIRAGDIIEYEIPAVLDEFLPFLEKVKEQADSLAV